MKKILSIVLIVSSLVIAGSVSAYFLYILPQIENAKLIEDEVTVAPVTDVDEVEPEIPSNEVEQAEAKPATQPIVNKPKQTVPVIIENEPQTTIEEDPKAETVKASKSELAEDSALVIEKCKVNSNQSSKESAEEAKQNYLSQKVNSGFCLFPESQATTEARATINKIIAQYKVELSAAEASGNELKITIAKTDLLKAETALSQLESSLQAQTRDCLNGVIADAEDFYKHVYQQKYDTAYQQCINGE
jgi:hypothetical protein